MTNTSSRFESICLILAVASRSPIFLRTYATGSLDEFFGRFFDMPSMPGVPQAPRESQALGSGFIVDSDGYVITNHHVIEGASKITVTLQDERQFDATLVGQDEKTDLALLKIDGEEAFVAVELGDSDRVRIGDWVLAIGNPFGLGGTATAGIVSARGRDIQSGPYDDYLQIDAPINSGNSGGPVFNGLGEVIGVNTAIYSPSGGNVGIGFAIPSNQVKAVTTELRTAGAVSRGWLGVQIQALDEDLAASLGLETADGALVADVVHGSPADEAGIRAGDVVTALNAQAVDSPRTLSRLVGDSDPDEEARLTVWRDGKERTIRVTLGRPDTANPSPVAPRADRSRARSSASRSRS
jgi:serine protease Do